MCWNADISLNTFLFSCFAMVFIYITNTYTKYKTPSFDNGLVYLFIGLGVSMQLLEFFLWRNLNNKKRNAFLTKIIASDIALQPFILMFLIKNPILRYGLLALYILFIAIYLVYKLWIGPFFAFQTTVSKNGHLSWSFHGPKSSEKLTLFIYLAFYVTALFLIDNLTIRWFCLITLLISGILYYKDYTIGSMWCWMINLVFLYFIVHILLIQPFMDYNKLC